MANLIENMKTLSNNSASHATSLKEIVFHIVISIEGQHEDWETCRILAEILIDLEF
jgi:hypothetical protein